MVTQILHGALILSEVEMRDYELVNRVRDIALGSKQIA